MYLTWAAVLNMASGYHLPLWERGPRRSAS
jgi:hypothetical protein